MEELQNNRFGNHRGMNPRSRKNLEGLEKRNLKGNNRASKDYSITKLVKGMIDDKAEDSCLEGIDRGKEYTWRQAIALRMLRDAVHGKYGELLDRLEGKVLQPVGGERDNPLEVIVRWDGNKRWDGNRNGADNTPTAPAPTSG